MNENYQPHPPFVPLDLIGVFKAQKGWPTDIRNIFDQILEDDCRWLQCMVSTWITYRTFIHL